MNSGPSSSPHIAFPHFRPTLTVISNNTVVDPIQSPISPTTHVPLSDAAHKENTPAHSRTMALAAPASLKRKHPEREDSAPSAVKKPRQNVPSVTITLKPPKPRPFASAPIPMSNACPDYPNGFIYCHQCSKKRDVTDAIQCTFLETHTSTKEDKPPRQRRCVGKFCKFCLKNRYDQDFDDVVNIARSKKKEPGHVDSAGYIYKCPKCCDSCNCPRCRKSKGLEPTGSAGTIRKVPPPPPPKAASTKEKVKGERKGKTKAPSASTSKVRSASAVKKPKPKPLPIVKWTPITTSLTLADAEERFNIREFILRFADLMEPPIPRTCLEELEEVGGGKHQGREEEEIISWVSELGVKSVIIGLLGILAKELNGTLATATLSAIKEIRSLGVNLNKIWPILASLRDISAQSNQNYLSPSILSGSNIPFSFAFPDPLPPPAMHDIRAMRSTRHNDPDGLYIAYSAQMIPVISGLIDDVLLTTAVREEIDAGVREGKETTKDAREAVKKEGERWEHVRKTMETHVKAKAQILENRAKREYHKRKLQSLDNALKVVMPKYAPRLTPVGTDTEERVYWILSPGMLEREAALDFIRACAREEDKVRKSKKKARVLNTVEERTEMRQWSWFVAVWGRKPSDTGKALQPVKLKLKIGNGSKAEKTVKDEERASSSISSSEDERDAKDEDVEMGEDSDPEGDEQIVKDEDSDETEDDGGDVGPKEDKEHWWGFHEPSEILKLAEWLAMKAGLDESEPQPNTMLNADFIPQQDNQDSRASSSTMTLNGSISTANGIVNASMNGNTGSGKSRDTSVTVVGDPNPNGNGKDQLGNLVDELRTFAGMLEWRIREDKYDLSLNAPSVSVGSYGGGTGKESKAKERDDSASGSSRSK